MRIGRGGSVIRSYRHISFRCALLASAVALAVFASVAAAQTYNFQVLHTFTGAPEDGDWPASGVHFDNAGNLYGTTYAGGAYGGGTIYKIANDGTESILYSFNLLGSAGFASPNDIAVDPETGDIYGTTTTQGHNNGDSDQIYKLTADGTFTTLYVFNPDHDGTWQSGVIRDPQGNLYGTLEFGPAGAQSKLFEYGADGSFRVLHVFKHVYNQGPLIRDVAGNLYGFGALNTVAGCGVIYKLARDGGSPIVYLHTFTPDDGCQPETLTGDRAGNLYGTTGGYPGYVGTIFRLAPDGTFTTLHTFDIGNGGFSGWGLTNVTPMDGNLYGAAFYGGYYDGLDHSYGVMYRIASDGTYTKLFGLPERSGHFLTEASGLTLNHGRLYGMYARMYTGDDSPSGIIYSFGAAKQ